MNPNSFHAKFYKKINKRTPLPENPITYWSWFILWPAYIIWGLTTVGIIFYKIFQIFKVFVVFYYHHFYTLLIFIALGFLVYFIISLNISWPKFKINWKSNEIKSDSINN